MGSIRHCYAHCSILPRAYASTEIITQFRFNLARIDIEKSLGTVKFLQRCRGGKRKNVSPSQKGQTCRCVRIEFVSVCNLLVKKFPLFISTYIFFDHFFCSTHEFGRDNFLIWRPNLTLTWCEFYHRIFPNENLMNAETKISWFLSKSNSK